MRHRIAALTGAGVMFAALRGGAGCGERPSSQPVVPADRPLADHRPDPVDHLQRRRDGKRPDHPAAAGVDTLRAAWRYRRSLTRSSCCTAPPPARQPSAARPMSARRKPRPQ